MSTSSGLGSSCALAARVGRIDASATSRAIVVRRLADVVPIPPTPTSTARCACVIAISSGSASAELCPDRPCYAPPPDTGTRRGSSPAGPGSPARADVLELDHDVVDAPVHGVGDAPHFVEPGAQLARIGDLHEEL